MSAAFLEIIYACKCDICIYTLKYFFKKKPGSIHIPLVAFSLWNCTLRVTPHWHQPIQVGMGRGLGQGELLSCLVLNRPCPRPLPLLEKQDQWSHNPQLLPSLWGDPGQANCGAVIPPVRCWVGQGHLGVWGCGVGPHTAWALCIE